MSAQQVTELIEKEIAGDWDRQNPHGVNLKKCLVVPPVRKTYDDACHGAQIVDLWLVLEENPEKKSGYKIVFDDSREQFGLAVDDARTCRAAFIGCYGTFLETLDAM